MRRLSAAIGRPVTFALNQNNNDPGAWRRMLDLVVGGGRGRRTCPSAGAWAHGVAAARAADVPSVQLLPDVGDRIGLLPWREQEAQAAQRSRPAGPAGRRRRPASRTIRSCPASCIRRGSTCSATRRTTSRRRRAASPASPRPRAARSGRRSTTCCSSTAVASCSTRPCSTTRTATSTRPARCSCTRRPRSDSVTAARTRARRATRAPRRTCSATGRATGSTIASRSSWPCTSSPGRPRRCSVSATAACSRRA